MKKFVFVFALILSLFTAKANQVLGGELGWTCQGNGNYVFEVVVYYDCSQASTAVPTTTTVNWSASVLSIICNLQDSISISPDCMSTSWGISCDTTVKFSPVKKYIYRSNPMTLAPTIPATGWTFSALISNRFATDNTVGSSNNFVLRAKMYPFAKGLNPVSAQQCYDNSPKFAEKPRYAFLPDANLFFIGGSDEDRTDSLFYDFAPSLSGSMANPDTINYAPGYAFNRPLPDTLQNSNNIAMSVFPVGQTYFKSQTTGRFTNCYKIESWRDGQKIAEVFQDFEIQINDDVVISGICGGTPNLPPAVSLGWYANYDTLEILPGTIGAYSIEVLAGDSIKFKINGFDVDIQPNCQPQVLTASAAGTAMNFGTQVCSATPCAVLNSLNFGGGFSSSLNNDVEFFWKTDTAHVDKSSGRSVYWFYFSFEDSHCSLTGISDIGVKVIIKRPTYAQQSKLAMCAGDTVTTSIMGDTTNLLWSPSTGISCASCANPMFYPSTTTTYTATDTVTGYTLNVDVEVDAPAAIPALVQNGPVLNLGNPAAYDTIVWRRNGAPFFPQPNNTFTPWLTGDYWVEGGSGICMAQSDTFSFEFASNMSATSSSNGSQSNLVNASKTYGTTIRLNQEPFYRIDGLYVTAFDKNAQGANVGQMHCKIYNQAQSLVFQSDSVSRVSNDVLKFHGVYNLASTEDYLLTFYLDTSVIVPTFAPVVWPVVANNGRVLVYNATTSAGDFYPATSATDYPFFNISLQWHIGLDEEDFAGLGVYPNPANDVLVLTSLSPARFKMLNNVGQIVASGEIEDEFHLATNQLTAGVYVIEFTVSNGNTKREKVIIAH